MEEKILIVDDEPDFLRLLKRLINSEFKGQVFTASSSEEALRLLETHDIDVACLDIKMPGMDGFGLLSYINKYYPLTTVIMITAYGCIEVAVKAIKEGAYDFITKPIEQDVFLITLKKALERARLTKENLRLRESVKHYRTFQNIVGSSSSMLKVYEVIRMVAPTDATVLIRGESGTGKELVARAIHDLSPRSSCPFVTVNCPAVPEQILESELFGYKKGAFTQAFQDKKGLFQSAQGGTIFLDEIGDIPVSIQTKLLRVLQEKEIKPLGDNRTIKVDVRIIASTNQDLTSKMKEGTFREDLFYRLNVVSIHLPPLRERKEDIPLLVEHFIKKYSQKFGKVIKAIDETAMERLIAREWKGNVRELENVIMRAIIFTQSDKILPQHIDFGEGSSLEERKEFVFSFNGLDYHHAKRIVLEKFHKDFIGRLLEETRGNISKAARMCGLERQALQHIIKKYRINVENYRQTDEL